VQIWEEYEFIHSMEYYEPLETLSEQQSAWLIDQLAECPLLSRILHAYLWAKDKVNIVHLDQMRSLLNVSWDELRPAIYRLQPICGKHPPDLYKLSLFIHNSMMHPSSWRANISIDLAFGCIRVVSLIVTGDLPDDLW
jgi:hypothetical protein